MNHAMSLNDGALEQMAAATLPAKLGATEEQKPQAVPPPMPTKDVFTPLPGEVRKPCCGGRSGGKDGTIVNVNVNAGNVNGVPANADQAPKVYNDSQQMFSQQQPVRVERVEVPVDRVVEKLVYRPMVMVREKLKKLFEYKPQKMVYEKRVGQQYNDQRASFEGSSSTTKTS